MGAWSYHAFGNDEALDWMSAVNSFMSNRVREGLQSDSYYKKRAAVELLIQSLVNGNVYAYENVSSMQLAIVELEAMLDDKKWVDSWSEPKRLVEDIYRQLSVVESYLGDLEEQGFRAYEL